MAALTAQDPAAKRVKALCTPARATQKVAAADSDRRPSREGIGTAVGTGTPAGDPDATAEGIRDGHATVLLDERRAARSEVRLDPDFCVNPIVRLVAKQPLLCRQLRPAAAVRTIAFVVSPPGVARLHRRRSGAVSGLCQRPW